MHENYIVSNILQGIGCTVLYCLRLMSPCKYTCVYVSAGGAKVVL